MTDVIPVFLLLTWKVFSSKFYVNLVWFFFDFEYVLISNIVKKWNQPPNPGTPGTHGIIGRPPGTPWGPGTLWDPEEPFQPQGPPAGLPEVLGTLRISLDHWYSSECDA